MTNHKIPACTHCDNKSIFCNLSEDNKEVLGTGKGHNFFKKGQTIFYEGNHTIGVFCVYSGKVKLSKLGKDGKEQIVRFSKPGDIIGYRALLSNEPYQATAIALEDSYICMISKEKFLSLLDDNTKLSTSIIQLLSKDLKGAEQNLIDLTQKSVKERIVESLVLIINTFGFKADNKTIALSLSRQELANIAGTSSESTIRTLATLNKEGVIKLVGRNIVVHDFDHLKKLMLIFD